MCFVGGLLLAWGTQAVSDFVHQLISFQSQGGFFGDQVFACDGIVQLHVESQRVTCPRRPNEKPIQSLFGLVEVKIESDSFIGKYEVVRRGINSVVFTRSIDDGVGDFVGAHP